MSANFQYLVGFFTFMNTFTLAQQQGSGVMAVWSGLTAGYCVFRWLMDFFKPTSHPKQDPS